MSEIATDRALRFTVLGRPQSKGSKRALPVKGRSYPAMVDSNPRARAWAAQVKVEAAREMTRSCETALWRGPVQVELEFYFARPKGHYGSGRNADLVRASAPPHMTTMPDIDKLARCAIDALIGVVVADDSQLVELMCAKSYGEPERVEMCVCPL